MSSDAIMSKGEFVKKIAEKTNFSQDNVRKFISALETVVYENVQEYWIKVIDGLTVGTTYVEGYVGRNPATGENVEVPGKNRIKFKLGAKLKRAANPQDNTTDDEVEE